MSWYTVASAATLDGLQDAIPAEYQEIPVGKRTRIVINTSPLPVAPIFDLAGAEFAAQLLQHGGKLIDVSGNGAFEIVFEIEAVDTMAQPEAGEAEMHLPQLVLWIGVVAGVLVLLPLVTKLATLFANFIPGSSGDGSSGGIIDYLKTLFGDYTPYVLIGGAIVLFLLLKPGRSDRAPVIYNLPSGSRRARDDDED